MAFKDVSKNMGIFYLLLIVIFICLVLYAILRHCVLRYPCFNKVMGLLKSYLFFTAPIKYMHTSYFRLAAIFFSLFLLDIRGTPDFFTILYAAITIFFTIWPFLIVWLLLSNFTRLSSDEFKVKYKSLFVGLKIESTGAMAYYAIFSIRRFDLILNNVFFSRNSPISGYDRHHYYDKIIIYLFM